MYGSQFKQMTNPSLMKPPVRAQRWQRLRVRARPCTGAMVRGGDDAFNKCSITLSC